MGIVEREIKLYGFGDIDRLSRRDLEMFDETKRCWKAEGWNQKYDQFLYDESPYAEDLVDLVGTDVPLEPAFEEKIIAENDPYVQIRTISGAVEQFPKDKSRLTGEIMPLYVKEPVETEADWYHVIKPRLNPATPERRIKFNDKSDQVADQVNQKKKLYSANTIGGYMFLRALLGLEDTLLAFYDHPKMVHDMMRTWRHLVLTCLIKSAEKGAFFSALYGRRHIL